MAKRRNSGRPTINDVARHAQVSAITVSRTLSTPARVSEKLRERVAAAIAALNYVPDPKARALASGRTTVIGVIVPSLSNIVFADTLRGIHDAVAGTDYQVQIGNTRYDSEEEDRLISLFLGQRPAALIITGLDQSKASRQHLEECDFPIIQIMEIAPAPIDMAVGFFHDQAGQTVAEHLIAKGYKNIGCIGARMDPRVVRRLTGFRETLKRHDLYCAKRDVTTEQESSVQLGRGLLHQMLESDPQTDAVFCVNDDLALGALFEARSRGLAVPDQLGIAGFNDFEMMAAAEPALTSVRTNRYEMGKIASQMALQRLNSGSIDKTVVDLGYELIERASTCRDPSATTEGADSTNLRTGMEKA